MKQKQRNSRIGAIAGIALLGASIAPAVEAKTPAGLSDLVGARGSSGETALGERGYAYVSTKEQADRKLTYWWNKDAKQCAVVTTYDGRYESIDEATKKDCGKSDNGTAVAAAIGAAAVIGAIALASSGKKDKDRYPSGSSQATPYALRDLLGVKTAKAETRLRDRGYKFKSDGSGDDRRWAYWWNKRATPPCIAVATRDGRFDDIVDVPNSYCGKSGGSWSGGNGGSWGGGFVSFEDLNGARASSADSELRQRGFLNVDGFKSGYATYTIWNRPQSGQCLQMMVTEGRVEDIRDIRQHPKCR